MKKSILLNIILIIIVIYCSIVIFKDNKIYPKEAKCRTILFEENKCMAISKVALNRLKMRLKKREHLSLNRYFLNGVEYIYYGHQTHRGERFNNTEIEADSVLLHDIKESYFEVNRRESNRLYEKMYKVFISGKY